MSSLDAKSAPLLLLPAALLLLAAAVLYWGPVRGYVVSCERTVQVVCSLERTEASGPTRTLVPLGTDASAVVRVQKLRRGSRVLLYLEAPPQSVFAAEFEDGDAQATATAAAAQLNRVLHGSTPGPVRIEVTPPPLYRWLSWAVISFMGLLLLAAYRQARSRPAEQGTNRPPQVPGAP